MSLGKNKVFLEVPPHHRSGVNPYGDLVALSADLPLWYGPRLRGCKGHWADLLGVSASRLVLEIGCHHGKILKELCFRHPDWGFLGCDITYKRVYKSALELKNHHLIHGGVILAPAEAGDELFAREELAGLILFCPDPWERQRQNHRKLLQENFIKSMMSWLQPGAFVWVKSDHSVYYSEIQELFSKVLTPVDPRTHVVSQIPCRSLYEERFLAQGFKVKEGLWVKNL